VVGVGYWTLVVVLAVLGIPPILTNTFVGIRQADRATVDAARGIGMTEFEVLRKTEMPMAVASIMGGVRTSSINIIATATIAPLAGVLTLGNFILNENVYGADGVLAGAIVVAVVALIFEFAFAGLQRRLTSKGLRLQAQ
jgi:osmoprotectant transport system permease protein